MKQRGRYAPPPPQPELVQESRVLTRRDFVQFCRLIETNRRMNTAMLLGAPITRECARAEALAAMSDEERALLADDVTNSAPPRILEAPHDLP